MATLNKVLLIGRVIRDVENKETPNSALVKFGLSVGVAKKKQDGNWDNSNQFIMDCECWRPKNGNEGTYGVIKKYVQKGSNILVEGELGQDSWDDKTTGSKRTKMKLKVNAVQLLDSKNSDGSVSANNENGYQGPSTDFPSGSDDIPF
jgi:single-strand DNA-binding protein